MRIWLNQAKAAPPMRTSSAAAHRVHSMPWPPWKLSELISAPRRNGSAASTHANTNHAIAYPNDPAETRRTNPTGVRSMRMPPGGPLGDAADAAARGGALVFVAESGTAFFRSEI